ncbi:MAG: type II toxin-antitoxin system PemK/MazF family toxin [Candidatus Taylorbacteria bacterium]
MSTNNYIQIEETPTGKYYVSEMDFDTNGEISVLGTFDLLYTAAKEAENHIRNSEFGVEYGIRFSFEDPVSINKEFDSWNFKKKLVHIEKPRLYTVREVWWCRLGINIGSEQDGNGEDFLRPVLIIRGFGANICMVIPLTTSLRKHYLRVPIGEIQGKHASAILSQVRAIDTRRLVEKIGFLEIDIFQNLRKTVKKLF